jgi:hypothetical protein
VPRSEESRTAHAPREVCWGILTDVERTPEWSTIASSVRTGGALDEGQTLGARGGALGVQVDLRLLPTLVRSGNGHGFVTDREGEMVHLDARHRAHVVIRPAIRGLDHGGGSCSAFGRQRRLATTRYPRARPGRLHPTLGDMPRPAPASAEALAVAGRTLVTRAMVSGGASA